MWLIEAVEYNVLPIDDRSAREAHADMAGRPTLIQGNKQVPSRGWSGSPRTAW